MKLLKVKVSGLPQFTEALEIDFLAQQRVDIDKSERLCNLFSNIYINNAIAFIGINASGKTTILKVISFIISLLNNEPVNGIESKDILDNMSVNGNVIFESYFYCNSQINKLVTTIKREINRIDNSEKYLIDSEALWTKNADKIKTKKSIFDFNGIHSFMERNKEEEYLMDDVSIMIAYNKKFNGNCFFRDMSKWTNFNVLNLMGTFPEELITFFDPSIEYLKFDIDEQEIDNKQGIDIRLKFRGKKEITMNNPMLLDKYLSSGTIKGMSVFMSAAFAFDEGGYLIVDELENHFNKEIVVTLIRFFLNHKVNRNGATIIFSTHYPELLDEFERNDNIYIVRNRNGITAENLTNILKRNDIKKSEAYQSDFMGGTVPNYESYIALKKVFISRNQ